MFSPLFFLALPAGPTAGRLDATRFQTSVHRAQEEENFFNSSAFEDLVSASRGCKGVGACPKEAAHAVRHIGHLLARMGHDEYNRETDGLEAFSHWKKFYGIINIHEVDIVGLFDTSFITGFLLCVLCVCVCVLRGLAQRASASVSLLLT
jgi:hypothetical protein